MVITGSGSGGLVVESALQEDDVDVEVDFDRSARIGPGGKGYKSPLAFDDVAIDDYHTLRRCPLFHCMAVKADASNDFQ